MEKKCSLLLYTESTAWQQQLLQYMQSLEQNCTLQEITRLFSQNTFQHFPNGTFQNPAPSCKYIEQGRSSGKYWIQKSAGDYAHQVYCDMTRWCNSTGGWMRVADLNMTNPAHHAHRASEQLLHLRECVASLVLDACQWLSKHIKYSIIKCAEELSDINITAPMLSFHTIVIVGAPLMTYIWMEWVLHMAVLQENTYGVLQLQMTKPQAGSGYAHVQELTPNFKE